jgi:CTP synthase
VLVCRSEKPIDASVRDKLSMFCNVPVKAVIECRDVDSIYELPIALQHEGLDQLVVDLFGLNKPQPERNVWADLARRINNPAHTVRIGVVGKYIELQDAYKSVYESVTHAGIANNARVEVVRVDAEDLEKRGGTALLKGLDGILVPGGFGDRGIEGKIIAARYARENGVPYYGLCLGLQIAVIEFARNVLKLKGANSTEFDAASPHPVINMMEEQKKIIDKGATMRLGSYECALTPGSKAAKAYKAESVRERHRHRYEVNINYREAIEATGLIFAGLSPDGVLPETVERPDHPWFIGVQYHPELKSRPFAPHPRFASFIAAAVVQSRLV